MEVGLEEVLLKVVLFIAVQVLVYLILSSSSNIFSKNPVRSTSFKPPRSVSVCRLVAALADMPAGGEASPSSAKDMASPSKNDRTAHDHAS
ncbi:hypothetical protein Vadar_016313 [Vaccinium darrowii]|uniref:Uncharacterized protein n=1 Tax=Vaccinium darrowii TaxID=229202 RepID=A0ACB7ZCM6_9ERIC|nr:hypothetical protein Vadar_016313 [Vaccinium darrowii]